MEGERVSSDLSVFEMNRESKKMSLWAGPGGINTPRAQRSFMGGTAALAKTEKIRRFLAGCFGWVRYSRILSN
jgi:hypothetical protein